jgi:hypothetical protein
MSEPSRGDLARLVVQELAFRERVKNLPCSSPQEARQLAAFAYRCVLETPLDGGLTPLAMVRSHPVFDSGVQLVGNWLAGESFSLEQLEGAATAARRDAYTHSTDMVGERAAQWSVIAVIDAARAAAASLTGGEQYACAVEAASLACFYARAAGSRPSSETLQFQIKLADEFFPESTPEIPSPALR